MTKIFVGGSRRISRLDAEVKRRIDRIIEKRLPVLVGDASGELSEQRARARARSRAAHSV